MNPGPPLAAAADIAPGREITPEEILGGWIDSNFPVYCRDVSGRIVAVNVSFVRKFGRPASELRGFPAASFINADDLVHYSSAAVELARPPYQAVRTHRWLTPQGWRWISWDESRVVDRNGQMVAVRAVGHDVTRQRLAEELFHQISNAVEQSPVGTVITDLDGRVQYVNPKYTEISGLTLEEILERNLPVLRQGHANDESYRELLAAVRAGKSWEGELMSRRPDGATVWELVRARGLRNPAGEITNLLCLREDITERKRLEEQLRQAQKMESLGTLAGGIAHDFNNLLAVINGYAEVGLIHAAEDSAIQKNLREIKRAAQRATGLVRQILTFSRKAEADFVPLDLNQLVRDLSALLAETFPRTIAFKLDFQEGLPSLLADQSQFQQIVLNLCVNARDAMPAGGEIRIRTRIAEGSSLGALGADASKRYACLEVSDTGIGMSPEVRARIFEPFFTTKHASKGTGLGLAVVYGIVASHHGLIDLDTAPGAGTTFKIYLPVWGPSVAQAAAVQPSYFPGGNESLLVVDDEGPLRELLKVAFQRKGYRVASAGDGLEAIEMISDPACAIDAILLDFNMPRATGLEVLKAIQTRRPGLKVLVLSGHLPPDTRAQFEKLGQKDFVAKPYTLDELGRRLRQLLDA